MKYTVKYQTTMQRMANMEPTTIEVEAKSFQSAKVKIAGIIGIRFTRMAFVQVREDETGLLISLHDYGYRGSDRNYRWTKPTMMGA